MEGRVLEEVLSKDPFTTSWFQGFSNPDLCIQKIFLSKSKKPELFVLNTDNSQGPGIHWCIAIFFPPSNCEFFDPFGFHPKHYGFEHILQDRAFFVRWNNFRVQSFFSSSCGHHCLYYALKRARGCSYQEIMKEFSTFNFRANDRVVFKYLKENYGIISS